MGVVKDREPLTKEQQKLVEDNIYLVAAVIKSKCNYKYDEYDDLFQIGCLGLIKASQLFNRNKGTTFQAYAYQSIFNELKMEWRNQENQIRKLPEGSFSLDQMIRDKEGAEKECDNLFKADKTINVELEAELNYALERVKGKSKPKHWEVFKLLVIDDCERDKAYKILGISRSRANKIKMGVLNLLKDELNEVY